MEQKKHKWLAGYFKEPKNILTFAVLLILVAAGFFLRIRNLGYLSFWGDDGHTVIGTISILERGYPLLPSGFMLFHSILSYYLNVVFVLIFGATEFAFRLNSVILGCGSIIVIYFFGKEIANKFTGLLAAFIITFSSWYIHFSREARYYAALQFFVLISLYFFYKGFVKEQKPYRIVATVFFIISPLVHGNAFFLLIAFIALIFYRGRKFFKKHIVLPFIIILGSYLLMMINQVFFWQVGRSFYIAGDGGLRQTLGAFFRAYDPYYFKILIIMYPEMFYTVLSGIAVLAGIAIFMSVKKSYKFSNLYLNENEVLFAKNRARFGFNLFMLYFILAVSLLIFSYGRMYNQQRYIYFLMPVFVLIFSYTVFVLSFTLTKIIKYIYKLTFKKDFTKKVFAAVLVIIFMAISFFSSSGIDFKEAYAIPDIKHSDNLNTLYSISTAMHTHWDAETTGKYLAGHKQEGDIVITTEIYNSFPYTGQVDYWLWTGNLVSWQPYHLAEDGVLRDDTYGVELIRDIMRFIEILNENYDKNVWVLCSYSLTIPEHVDSIFEKFFQERQENLVAQGRDNVAKLYYFPKSQSPQRVSIMDFISVEPENILTVESEGYDTILLDFKDPASNKYLTAGWSNIEKDLGCWATGRFSVIFLDFKNSSFDTGQKSQMLLNAKPLQHAELTQSIKVLVNGQAAGHVLMHEGADFYQYSLDIDAGLFNEGINTVIFIYDYNVSPAEIGLGPDARKLSVLFRDMEIKNMEENKNAQENKPGNPSGAIVIPIVALHGIEPEPVGRYEIGNAEFEHLCKIISLHGYKTITFMDLLEHLEKGVALPEKPVILTSDDGYANIYNNAFPILKKYGHTMTVFLTTGFIAGSEKQRRMNEFDFDKPEIPRRSMLVWPEVKEMRKYGIEFQAHGVTHKRIGEIGDEEAYFEMAQSKADIEKNLGIPCLFIAWPHNSYSDLALSLLPQLGYKGAVTYRGGTEDLGTMDIYAIKRIPFYSETGAANYAAIMGLK